MSAKRRGRPALGLGNKLLLNVSDDLAESMLQAATVLGISVSEAYRRAALAWLASTTQLQSEIRQQQEP